MSHTTGRVVAMGTRIGPDAGPTPTPGEWTFPFTPSNALTGGPPRYVILHFTGMDFPGASRLEVNLGYGTDTFNSASGTSAWTRPIDPALGPIQIRYFGSGAVGGVTLFEYGSGEPTVSPGNLPGTSLGSLTNQDVFLHTNPYVEPTYETRLQCGAFDWQNAACAAPGSVQEQIAKATGIIISTHAHGAELVLSSCTVTLIDADLVISAAHCLNEGEVPSASVTFDFQTNCDGTRPAGYSPRFHKVKRIVRNGGNFDIPTDWLILQLETPPGGLGIAPRPLRASATLAGETIFTAHHPNGAVKKIQQGVLTSGTANDVRNLDYAGGSSGSALFDASGNVIGAALSRGPITGPCHVAYCSSRQVLNQLATPPAAPTPFDVMLVLDRSGSMSAAGTTMPGTTKMDEAEDAAQLFVQLVRAGAGDRMGMVAFSSTATRPPNVALNAVNAAHKTTLTNAIEALAPGGSTSIGDGLLAAMESLTPGANRRAVLLMTDGLQNTDPSIATGEGALGNTQLAIVGFGTEANLDGPRLTTLARNHGGIYTHTSQGLNLKKFFSLSFGNIFESGMLADPEFVLPRDERSAKPESFRVCEEERITAVIGWNDPAQPLDVLLRTPGGTVINAATAGVQSGRGQTWQFLRVTLPFGGEREGVWQWEVQRIVAGEFMNFAEVRYFVAVIADGGPKFQALPQTQRIYTGDPINPLVALRYANGIVPHGEVEVTIESPDVALGQITTNAGGAPPIVGDDPVDAFRATLQKAAGSGPLTLPMRTTIVPLFDDGAHQDGGLEPDGIWGNPLTDLTRYEGNYTFHARARFGDTCTATRETFWSVAVEPGIDPGRTTVEDLGGGKVKVTPRDKFGNPLGPGRGPSFDVTGQPGTTTGVVTDNGNGSYTVDVTVDPSVTGQPGIVITQPDRPPVIIAPPARPQGGCALWMWVVLGLFVVVLLIVLFVLLL